MCAAPVIFVLFYIFFRLRFVRFLRENICCLELNVLSPGVSFSGNFSPRYRSFTVGCVIGFNWIYLSKFRDYVARRYVTRARRLLRPSSVMVKYETKNENLRNFVTESRANNQQLSELQVSITTYATTNSIIKTFDILGPSSDARLSSSKKIRESDRKKLH